MAKKSKAAKAAAAESSSLNSTSNANPPQKSSPSTSSGSGSAAKPKRLEQEVPPPPPTFFPFASYTATVGVHTALLVFTAVFLPQAVTPTLHELLEPASSSQRSGEAQGRAQAQQTSLDRPQHPFLDALTLDPVATLILCVAALGAYAEVERRVERASVDGRKFANLLNAWLVTGAFALLFYAVLILFGAPLLSHIAHTALLAVLLAVLTAFPASYALGSPTSSETTRFAWLRLFAEFDQERPAGQYLPPPFFTIPPSRLLTLPFTFLLANVHACRNHTNTHTVPTPPSSARSSTPPSAPSWARGVVQVSRPDIMTSSAGPSASGNNWTGMLLRLRQQQKLASFGIGTGPRSRYL
ncbi:hypothetical protein B0H16DRAFT_1896735 [Mycena metata]|uniref:Uncharacterized protein n=1 Tax=Mycena metata TaxID=1033252 RepID=A0AAD7HII4_9AGAR|nr:hypothetical protein B0H16DRAFT_1896735 [Mycena metata]